MRVGTTDTPEAVIRSITALCRRTNAPNRGFYDTDTDSPAVPNEECGR